VEARGDCGHGGGVLGLVEKVGAVSAGAEKTKWCVGSGGKREWRSRREREVEGGRHCERVGSLGAV
jgi:hypothetical protein